MGKRKTVAESESDLSSSEEEMEVKRKEKKEKKIKEEEKKEKKKEKEVKKEKKSSKEKEEEEERKMGKDEHASKKRKTSEKESVALESPKLKEKDEEDGEGEGESASEEEKVNEETLIKNFRVSDEVRKNLEKKGIVSFFPIQYESFDHIYDGSDLIGRARTGTGKTFAFAVPLVERLLKDYRKPTRYEPQVIVMAPTRELAKQIAEDFKLLSKKIEVTCVYGGVPMESQLRDFKNGVHVLVGTPGRIKDHLNRQSVGLGSIDYVVLDEADEMLNIGFAEDIETILSNIPKEKKRQTLLFSATLPEWIKGIASKYLKPDHKTVDLIGDQAVRVSQTIEYISIPFPDRDIGALIPNIITKYSQGGRTIVFAETKKSATDLVNNVKFPGGAQCIHGDVDQKLRELTLQAFKDSKFKTLVATDVAARGLDIPAVELVVQTCCPKDAETFIHRSGRTGRAGREGKCVVVYHPRAAWGMENLVRSTGIKFTKHERPSSNDVIETKLTETLLAIEDVDPPMVKLFEEKAQKLIDEKGALYVLTRLLACACGSQKTPLQPSLFKGTTKETTLMSNMKTYSKFDAMEKLGTHLSNGAKGLGYVAWTPNAIYFDVLVEEAKNLLSNKSHIFSLCDSIPPGIPMPSTDRGNGGRGSSSGGWGGDRRGGNFGRDRRGGSSNGGGNRDRRSGGWGDRSNGGGRSNGGRGGGNRW